MTQNITVLGGGLVGGFMARMLARDPRFDLTLCDISEATLSAAAAQAAAAGSRLGTRKADLSDSSVLADCIAQADLVIGAVPGFLGYSMLKTVIEAGKNCVDISFFPEDPFTLSVLAESRAVTAIVDCGVMPGLGGMLAAHFANRLEVRERLSIMVGGLPVERSWPWEYRAPFSPADVIEEYLRPARLRIAGRNVEREALSEVELVDLPGVGTLESFNTDGLRSLLETLDFEDMVEKTLRYPGYAEKMRMLRHLGLFSAEPLDVGGQKISPLALTSRLLFEQWRLSTGMKELTVMRVEAEGQSLGQKKRYVCDLLDHTDADGEFSMSRTTGYPAIVAAEMLLAGELGGLRGVIAPETLCLGESSIAEAFFARLAQKGIHLAFSEERGA